MILLETVSVHFYFCHNCQSSSDAKDRLVNLTAELIVTIKIHFLLAALLIIWPSEYTYDCV